MPTREQISRWLKTGRVLDAFYLANADVPTDTTANPIERWIDDQLQNATAEACQKIYELAGVDPPTEATIKVPR